MELAVGKIAGCADELRFKAEFYISVLCGLAAVFVGPKWGDQVMTAKSLAMKDPLDLRVFWPIMCDVLRSLIVVLQGKTFFNQIVSYLYGSSQSLGWP